MVADMIRRYPTIQVDQETVMIVVEDEEEFPLDINIISRYIFDCVGNDLEGKNDETEKEVELNDDEEVERNSLDALPHGKKKRILKRILYIE